MKCYTTVVNNSLLGATCLLLLLCSTVRAELSVVSQHHEVWGRIATSPVPPVWPPVDEYSPAIGDMAGAPRYLVVRYDDYFPRESLRAGQIGIELEKRLFELFHAHDARLIVAVVPFPTAYGTSGWKSHDDEPQTRKWLERSDDAWVALLRRYAELGIVVPALHGYSHLNRAAVAHRPGEFPCQPYAWQYEMIKEGRDALAAATAARVRVFVPPYNAWDTNTALALAELGFEWLSADLHHADSTAVAVRQVPMCSWVPNEVLELLRTDHEIPSGSIVVLVTHPVDFEGEKGQEYFRALEELLAFVRTDPDWTCVGLSDLPKASTEQWQGRFRRAVTWRHAQRLLQDSWAPPLLLQAQPVIYMPADWYASHTWPWQAAVAATMLLSAALGWLVSWLIARRVLRSCWLIWAAALLAAAALVTLVLGALAIHDRGYALRGVRWQAIATAAGSTLALVQAALARTLTRARPVIRNP